MEICPRSSQHYGNSHVMLPHTFTSHPTVDDSLVAPNVGGAHFLLRRGQQVIVCLTALQQLKVINTSNTQKDTWRIKLVALSENATRD